MTAAAYGTARAGARAARMRQKAPEPRRALRYDPMLLAAVLVLLALGVVMVYSASAVYASARLGDGLYFVKRQSLGVLAGLCGLLAVLQIGYARIEKLALPFLFVCLALLVLVHLPGVGHAAGGARRWLHLFGVSFQPSEPAKLALICWLARSLSRKQERLDRFSTGTLPHLLVLAVFAFLLLCEPDFGTAVVLAAITFALLFVAGAPLRHLAAVLLAAAPVTLFLVWHERYRWQRVLSFLDPWADPRGRGYQAVESLLGFGAGGAFGVGLGESHQKLFFLPAAHTDFILSIVGEELGFAGVAGVLALFACLVLCGIRAAHAAKDAFGCYLALGLTLLLGAEALVNGAMALSLLPTKGIALPFLSYGLSSVITSTVAAGLLLSVSGGPGGFLRRSPGGLR